MFRNRRSSQKPGPDLYASFRQSFPNLSSTVSSASPVEPSLAHSALPEISRELPNPSIFHATSSEPELGETLKDADPTPRGLHDAWRLTPSILDPNSFAFASFANQPPGYYTPTTSGTNTLYHSRAGDLHTPRLGIGLGTPLSMSNTNSALRTNSLGDLHSFHSQVMHQTSQTLDPHQYHNFHSFAPHNAYAPSHFSNQHDVLKPRDRHGEPSPLDGRAVDTEMPDVSPLMGYSMGELDRQLPLAAPQDSDTCVFLPFRDLSKSQDPTLTCQTRFRFHVTLNAPTAMVKHQDEVPVTYLNKGQSYTLSISDTAPPQYAMGSLQYRTFIRISFEDEQQRQRPAACWQLWKEGRGINEAHQRGGRLQAVEYVEPTHPPEGSRHPVLELDTASFDGFSVLWTPGSSNASSECSVAVRFNFLSTDFSHSKGVKGIPVRLCAKTELLTPQTSVDNKPELCYCKVKLFRDHGAERKLANDIAHIKKTIEKLTHQMSQLETGAKDSAKRKRISISAITSTSKQQLPCNKPGKVTRHKRTWSMSSSTAGATTGSRISLEEESQSKLATMQDMFTSTKPVSILNLRGPEADDPDINPVYLPGEPHDLTKVDAHDAVWNRRQSVVSSHNTEPSSRVSPSSPSASLHSLNLVECAASNLPATLSSELQASDGNNWNVMPNMVVPVMDLKSANPQHLASPPELSLKIPRVSHDDADSLPKWIDALGVDSSYQAPPDRTDKAVACVYILPNQPRHELEKDCYLPVYLKQRTTQDLVNGIASKCNMDPSDIIRITRLSSKLGITILVDDEFVQELPEGQDMKVEFSQLDRPTDSQQADSDPPKGESEAVESSSIGFEIRLLF
ncbi:MAG: hypothetical protein M1829_004843 [Trizodia sp. TS-e1964]|nr:MAG: hypothetical protein M1829_004843 [Trizodia sp. TS-e1964]